jgi:environmental stress-induced protein Ves
MANYIITKKEALKTNTWAGGTTTQLAIFPTEAEYTKFNFDFRISYATVEIPASTFTFMPGVTRHLTILKGDLIINHIDRYEKHLSKFDTDVFNGEWLTTAKGQVTDFNLMTRGNTKGEVVTLVIAAHSKHAITLENKFTHLGIYLFAGMLNIKIENETINLEEGDFILLNNRINDLDLNAIGNCEIIISKIFLNN